MTTKARIKPAAAARLRGACAPYANQFYRWPPLNALGRATGLSYHVIAKVLNGDSPHSAAVCGGISPVGRRVHPAVAGPAWGYLVYGEVPHWIRRGASAPTIPRSTPEDDLWPDVAC